nr:CPPV039 ankyrin repeat protein [Cooks petrelpox virus]
MSLSSSINTRSLSTLFSFKILCNDSKRPVVLCL